MELPDTFRGAERQQDLLPGGSGTEITLTVRLHIGRYVSHIENVGLLTPVGYYSTEGSYVIRQEWVVTCDPMNQTFYAEGGRLYHRADGTPADKDASTNKSEFPYYASNGMPFKGEVCVKFLI